MQTYPAYTWDRIDEELSVFQINQLMTLWGREGFSPIAIDIKFVCEAIKSLLKGV